MRQVHKPEGFLTTLYYMWTPIKSATKYQGLKQTQICPWLRQGMAKNQDSQGQIFTMKMCLFYRWLKQY